MSPVYLKNGLDSDAIEPMYKKAHAAIRKDPAHKPSGKPEPKEHKRFVSYFCLVITILALLFYSSPKLVQIQPRCSLQLPAQGSCPPEEGRFPQEEE